MKKEAIPVIYRLLAIILGVTALIYQIADSQQPHVLFYFFTIWMNILCMVVFLFLLINRERKLLEIRGAMTTGIVLVMLVFHFMLRPSSDFYGAGVSYYDLIFHYVMPIMVLLDFIVFAGKKKLKLYQPLLWSGVPIVYLIFVFVRAAVGNAFETGYGMSRYPYYFLDVDALGGKMVAVWIVAVLLFYVVLGYLILGIEKIVSGKRWA